VKREVGVLDATPSKRLFLSIIADYDLAKSLCELIDNALDVWTRNGKKRQLHMVVKLDERQQTICVEDDAGGLREEELPYIVSPGQTGTAPSDQTIGIFGVGTKRAVVALAQEIKIRTRFSTSPTREVDFDDSWLESDSWDLPVYETDDIAAGTTIVDLQRLRIPVTQEAIDSLKEHLGVTYARFLLDEKVSLTVNDEPISPHFFENWAYPPKYEPRRYSGQLNTEEGGSVDVEVVAGLSLESSPAAGEYGVYIYCNDRLVARALKTYDVGFARGLAGLPHPKVSLTRVVVSLSGDATAMPWNSSKSDIHTTHEVFVAIRDWLVGVVKEYATVSRALEGQWPEEVFKYKEGQIKPVQINDFPTARHSYLPNPPKSRPRYGDLVVSQNRQIAKRKPWTTGLYEGVIAADLIGKQRKLEQKNRIELIVLDSTLEIAFKEFLVNEVDEKYGDKRLADIFGDRSQVHDEVKKHVSIDDDTWKKIDFYYAARCKLVHERASVNIGDSQIGDFRQVVQAMLTKLYELDFS